MSHELMVGGGRDGSALFEVGSGSGGGSGSQHWEGKVGEAGDEEEDEFKQCRICHDGGDKGDMEAPCACSGSIKFAHKRCIQRWCHIKGDMTCEICNQVYSGNYNFPASRPTSDAVAIDIRASRQDLLHAEYEDYAAANNSRVACCRCVAFVVMLCFFMHHVLIVAKESGVVQEASEFYNVSLQLAGFVLPCYVIVQSCYILQSQLRRRQF
ncbi:uncharacterized protein [Typha latifolia]|uniref:uncharacterized protein isoform X1 n=1 Tax=Typha latifolia TaxID=4733 RepID=UPI003C2B3F25